MLAVLGFAKIPFTPASYLSPSSLKFQLSSGSGRVQTRNCLKEFCLCFNKSALWDIILTFEQTFENPFGI